VAGRVPHQRRGGDVVDALFSRVPHVLGDRLGEIAAAYPAPARAALPQKAGSEGRAEEGGAEEGRPAGRKGARSGSSE
jgi:hypothetical protein